jgi:hypothetical protein
MPYWMTNPEHGMMPVYSMGEVERAQKSGWALLNEGEGPVQKPKDTPPEVARPDPAPPRRGRKAKP